MRDKYESQAQELQEKLFRLKQEYQTFQNTVSPQNQWFSCLKKYQDKTSITREMVLELIESIHVSGHHEVAIRWNFQDEFARLEKEAGKAGIA